MFVSQYTGPTGILRASHRAQDPQRSTPMLPYHPHDKEDKVPPGDIVKLEISGKYDSIIIVPIVALPAQ